MARWSRDREGLRVESFLVGFFGLFEIGLKDVELVGEVVRFFFFYLSGRDRFLVGSGIVIDIIGVIVIFY